MFTSKHWQAAVNRWTMTLGAPNILTLTRSDNSKWQITSNTSHTDSHDTSITKTQLVRDTYLLAVTSNRTSSRALILHAEFCTTNSLHQLHANYWLAYYQRHSGLNMTPLSTLDNTKTSLYCWTEKHSHSNKHRKKTFLQQQLCSFQD